VPPERIDLHMHSTLSDGALIPAECLRRAVALGYQAVAITDHVDWSNIELVLPPLLRFAREQAPFYPITFLVGVELTHTPPVLIAPLARRARELGAQLVIVHGETIVEPVINGTNYAAAACPDVDVLAHPGLIEHRTVEKAAENDVYIELSGRPGHAFCNGLVAARALEFGAKLILNSDAHEPEDMFGQAMASAIAAGAGLNEEQVQQVLLTNPIELIRRCQERSLTIKI
jgi:putative hydrolase